MLGLTQGRCCEMLAKSLAGYRDYLGKSSKKMRLHHSSPVPVREISDGLNFQFLPVSGSTISSNLVALRTARDSIHV